MAAGMLMPLDKLRSIYEALFRDGVMVAKKDRRPDSIHQELVGVTNLQVSRAMASLKSRGFVRETFTWRHHYWYLSNEGIGYLRDYLHLPPEIVPVTLHRVRQPLPASLPGRRPQTGPLGAGRGRGTARAYGGDDRENYRSGTQAQAQARAIPEGKDGGASVRKVESAGLGSAQSFEFRGGYVRPSRASLPPAKAVEDDDERERVQKKTFTKWVNSHLVKSKRQVNDLYEDLRDGHNLISLLELLSGEMLPRERGSMLVHKMQNIKIALDFMQRRQIKLVNIRSDDIAEGNPKLTLGLIWTIILHFQVSDIQVGEQHRDLGAKERLLLWVRRVVQEYPDLRCDNFTTSWRDGRLFNAIIHRHRPDLLDMKKVYQQNNQQNLEQAFSLAEQNLRVPRLLDTEDVDVKSPEEKSLVTYVAALYEAFPKIPADGITIYEVDKKWKEYETKISFLLSWIKEKMQKVESQGSTMSREELKDFQILLLQLKEKDIPGRDGERASIEKLYKALQVWIDFGRIKVTPGQSPADVEKELGKLVKAIQAGETKAQQETSRLAKFAAASKPAAGPVDEIKVIEAQSVQAPLMQFQEQVKIPADIATKAKAAQAEAKAKAQREAKERERVDQEARALAEAIGREQLEAKAKEAEARAKAQEEAKAKAKAEQEAKEKAKAEAAAKEAQAKEAAAKAKAEEEARAKAKAEQEAKERAKAEAQAKEAAAKAKAEEEARAKAKAEQEAKERAKAEAQAKEAAAKAKAEEEARAKAKAEQEAKERAKAEAQAKEAAAKAKAEEEARAKAKAEQEAKEKAKAEAAAKEEQAKEAEAKAKAQEEARAKAKAEALAKAQEEEKARLIAQQQTKVRIQADAAAKALADSIAKQQEEAKAKEAEAKEREAVKAKEAEDARLRVEAEARALAESLSKAQAEGKAKEAEAKAQAEADQKLNFIKDLMALMEEKQMEIESADWGIDLSSVGANLQSHKNLHQVLEGLNTKVVEAQAYESKVPASRKKNYTDSLAALTATYNKSLAASGVRSTRLQELLAFLAPAEAELAWAKGQETEQLERDWSDKNADMEAQRKSLDASQKKLNEKQPIFADIKKLGEKLLSDKHPAKSTIEASLEGLGAQWAWLTQLGDCAETHLQENAAYFQFFRDVDDTGKELSAARDSLNQAYACDASTDVPRLESLLQQTHTEQRLVPLKGKVHELVGRSQSVLNLKPRRPGHPLKGPVTITAITDYTQPEVTVKKDQEYELKDNSDATRWRVASVGRKDATVPSVCFVLPSPNPDALQAAERLRQQHKDLLAAWNGKTADLRSLLAWHHLLQYTKIIRAWDLPTLKKLALGQKEEALKELERRRQAFLEERAASQAPGDAETAQAEAEVSTCKQHVAQLEASMHSGEHPLVAQLKAGMHSEEQSEAACARCVAALRDLRRRLGEKEERVAAGCRGGLQGDHEQHSGARVAQHEDLQKELEALAGELEQLQHEGAALLALSPAPPSSGALRSELPLAAQQRERADALLLLLVQRLRAMGEVVSSSRDSERCLGALEVRLAQEPAAVMDPDALNASVRNLKAIAADAAEPLGTALDAAGAALQRAEGADGPLAQAAGGHADPDLASYRERDARLRGRAKQLQTELAARLGDLEALSKKTAKFHEIHLWLMQLLERSGEKQKGLLAADKPDSQSVTLLLEQQKALVDELEKAQNKVDECRKSAEECASHVQKYDTRVSTYRTSVEKQLKTPAQWPAGSNVAEDLNKARSDLVGRYGTILGHAKQQVGFLSDDLKRIQDAEQATAQLNSQSQEEKLEETLKNAKVPQTFKGRNWTIWELLHSNYFTDEEKKMFLVDFQSGKRTMDEYYIYIIQFLQQKEKQRKKKEITFNGLRQEVTLEELVESEIIDENTAEQLIEGTKSVTDVSPSIERYLGGGRSIAGLYVEATKEKMPIDAAIKKNLLTLGTGMVLLEAQAATGSMIDPLNNTKLSVDEAVQKGLVSPEYQEKLRLAERAVTGYTDPITKKTISLFEAMEKEIILKQHGIRILEAQIATGGIIDPQNSHRLPIEVAYKRGLFDKTLHAALLDPSDDTKGFFDPNTTKNLTYLQLMKTCITDPDTGLCLLPLKVHEVKDVGDKATLEAVVQGTEQQLQTATHESIKETLKTTNVDITIKGSPVKKMTLEEIFASDLISDEDKDRLMKDFTSGKITIQEWIRLIIMFIKRREDQKAREEAAKEKVEDAVAPVPAQKLEHAVISEKQLSENFQKATVELPFGGHGDKKFSVAEIFQSGMIDEDNKKKLVEDYKSGKITFEQLILYIIEIIQVKRKPQKYESAPIPEPAEQQIAESLKTTIDIHFGRFAGKKPSIEDIFKSGLVNEGQKKQLLEDYKLGNITMEQLIMYIVQIIQQAEASQRKPEKQTDKTIPQTELRPDVPTPAVGIPQKEGPHISSEELAVENLKKTTLDLPFGSLAGKKYTLQEIFEGDLIDKHKKDQLMRDYKSGKISLEELMIFIIEIIRLKEREKTKKSITFHGIRTDVTVDDLVKSGLLKEDVANQLADGLITQDEVQKQVGGYLGGSSAIAGLYVEGTKETMSLYDGFKKNLIKTGTGLVLLEAQAASGFIIDPVKNEKLSVEEAVQKGVVGPEYKDKLLSAERAVTGYKDKFSGATFSVFQAMKNKLILKQHGIRLLEAQIATGGIIDPQASHRLPVEAAYKRGLFDEEMNQILSDPSDDTKGFFDPNTEENLTYMEQMQRCIIDPNTGLTLLPIKEKKGKRPEKKVPTQKEVAKATDDAQKLAAAPVPKAEKQEDVEALKKTTVNIQLGRFAGKNPSLDELLQSSLIPEEKRNKLLEDYKSGRISRDQLILYIIEFITESEQQKPIDEPVLKAAEKVESDLPDSIPLKPTQVPEGALLSDQQAVETLRKTNVDLPFGKFAGKKYTLQDIFDSDLIDKKNKEWLLMDFKAGKIPKEQLIVLIIDIIQQKEKKKDVAKATGDAQKLAAAPVPKAEKQKDVEALKKTTVNVQLGRFAGKNPSLDELLQSGLIGEENKNKLLEDYKSGRISKDQLILYIIEFITTAESEQHKPKEASEEPVLKAAETVQSVLPDGVPLKPTTVPAEDLQAIEWLKKKTVDLPFGKFAGKKYTLQDIFDSDLVDEDKKKQLMVDYKTGKITLEQLMLLIIEIIHLNEREKTKKAITFHGIRTDVTVDNLVKSGLLKEDVANQLADGLITQDEVQKQVGGYLGGSSAIAGLYVEGTKETMSLYDGFKKNLIKTGTGLVLLEAQAASGFIIDPVKNEKLSVEEAVQKGVVGPEYKDKLLSAERAVTGYKDKFSGATFSVFQAMKNKLILKQHGIRLLEAQIATGGIIDPQASHRLPVEVAYKRGLFDEEMNQILSDPSDDTKGFFDPNTEENLTYMEQMQRCIIDPDTGLTLLPIKEKKGKGPEKKVTTQKEVAKATDDAQKLAAAPVPKAEKQEDVKALKKTTVNIQVGRFAGKNPSLNELFQSGLIAEEKRNKLLEDYKSGKISKDQLILYIIEFITTAESEQYKPEKSSEEPVLKAAETIQSVLPDSVPLKPTTVPAEELQAIERLKKKTVDLPFGKFAGKKYTLQDIFDSDLVDEDKKKQLMVDYKTGKITLEQLMLLIIEIIRLNERERTKKAITFHGIRTDVTVDNLVKSGVLKEDVANQLADGLITKDDVQKQVRKYLGGSNAIAGLYIEKTKETMSLYDGLKKKLIKLGTGLVLLEAQAASGFIIDPVKDQKLSVEEAVQKGVVGREYQDKLLSAERAVTGYKDPFSKEKLSLFQAMKKELILKAHGIRLLEAQIATGGIIDPQASHRLPVEAAYKRGLFDEEMNQILSDPSDDTKGFFDPNTEENLTYMEQMQRCIIDPDTGLTLLPIKEKKGKGPEKKVPTQKEVAKATDDAQKLAAAPVPKAEKQEDVKALKKTTVNIQVGRFAGKNPSLNELLQSGLIAEEKRNKLLEDYKSGRISKDQLILYIIEFITTAESEQYKPAKSSEEPVLKAAETVQSVLPDSVPLKPTTVPAEELQAIERLKKKTVDLPFGKFAGKKYTLQDIFDSDLVDEDKKKQLMVDYKTGKITLEQLMFLIIEIIHLNEREKTKKAITFHGIRTDVTVDNLVKSGVLKEDVANQLADGLITKDDVQKQVRKYLGGSNAIAGLYIEKTKETMSLYDGLKKKLIKLGTGLVLLEAQAASGFIIDPVKDQKLSVEEAVQKGVVGREYQDKLLSAERAVTGYKDPFSKETLSLFQAMKKELILKAHGIRLLEAQIATGGIIDPQASHRLPVEAAYKRGLFDEEMNQILSDPSDDTKGFFDPNTEENLTYMEQMQRCIIDPDTGLTLLPIKEKKGKGPEKKVPTQKEVAKATDDAQKLAAAPVPKAEKQEDVEALKKMTVSIQVGRFAGKKPSLDELLQSGLIAEENKNKLLEDYKSGKISKDQLILYIIEFITTAESEQQKPKQKRPARNEAESLSPHVEDPAKLVKTTVDINFGRFAGKNPSLDDIFLSGLIADEKKNKLLEDYKLGKINKEQLILYIIEIIQNAEDVQDKALKASQQPVRQQERTPQKVEHGKRVTTIADEKVLEDLKNMAVELPFEQFAGKNASLLDVLDSDLVESDKKQQLIEDYKLGKITLQELYILIIEIVQRKSKPEKIKAKTTDPASPLKEIEVTKTVEPSTKLVAKSPKQDLSMSFENTTVELPFGMFAGKKASLKDIFESDLIDADKKNALTEDYSSGKITLEQLLFFVIEYVQAKELGTQEMKKKYLDVTEIDTPVQKHTPLVTKTVVTSTRKEGASAETTEALKQTTIDLPFGKFAGKNPSLQEILESDIIEDDKKEQLMNDYTSGKITLEQLLFFIIEIIQAKEGGKAGEKVLLKRLPEETGKPASSSVTSLVTKTVVTTTRREGLSPEQEALESLSRTTVKLPIGKYSDKSMSLQEILDSGEIEDAKKKELIDDYKIGKITLEQLLVLIIEIIQAKELGGTGHKVVVKKVTAEKQTPEDNGESSSSATQTVIKKTVVTTTSKAGSSPEDALETLKRTTIDLPIGKFAGKKMSLQEILDGGEIDEDKRKELMEDYKKGKINLEQLLVFIIEIIQAKESGTAQPKIVVKKMTSEPSDSADVDEPTSTSRSVVTKTVVTTRRQEGLSPEQEALESLSRTTVKLPIGKYSDKSMSLQEILDGGEIEDAKKKELIDDYKIGKITLEQLLVLIIEIIQAKELGGTGHKVVVKKVTAEKQTPEDNGESSSSATQTIIKKTVVTTTSKAGSSPEEALETLKRTTIDLPIGKFAGKKMSLQEILDGGEIDEDKRKELMEDYKKGKINLEQLLVFIIEIIQAKESGTAQPKIVVKKMTSEPSDSADVDEPTSTSRSVVTKTVVTTRRQEGLSPEQEALESLSRTTVKLPIGKYSDKSMSLQEILDGGEIEDAKKKELIDDYKTGKITLEQLLVLIIEIIQAKELGGTGHKVVVKKVTAEKQTPEDNGESSSSATQTVIKKTVVTTTSKAGSSPEEDALDTLKRTTIDLPIGKFAGKKMSLQEILDGGEIDEDKRKELMEDYKKGKINLEQLLVFIIEIIQAKESGTAQPKIVVKKMTSEPSDSADVDEPTSTSRSVVTKTVVTTRRQEGLSPEQEALESLSRTTVKLPIGKYSDKSMSLQEILDGGEIEDAKRKELIDDYKIGKITLEQLLVLIIEIIQAKELGGTGHKVVVKKVTAEKQTPEDNGESSSSATQTVIKKTVVTTTSKAGSSPEEDALDTLKRTTIDLPIGKFAGKKMSLQEILDGGEIDEDKRKELMEDYKKGKINLEQLLVFIIDIIQAKESGTAQPKIVVKKMTSEPSDSADVDEPTSTSRSVVTKTVVTTRRQEGLSPEQEALESLSRTTVKLPIGKYSDKSMSLQEILDGGEIEDAKKKELIDDYKIGKITLEQLLVLIIEIIQAKELGGTGHKVVVKKVTAEKQTPEDNGESSSSESQTVIKKTVVTTTRADSSSPEDALETLKRTTIDLPIGKFAGKKMSLQEILDGGEIDDMKRKELIDNYKSGKITLEQLLVFMIEFIQAKGSGVSGPKVTVKKVTAEKSSSSEIEDPTSPSRVASVVTKTVVTTTRKEGLSPEQEVLESLSRTTVKLPVGRFSNKSMSLQDILDSGEIDDVKRQELIDNYKTGKITLQDLLVYIIEIIQAKELGETGHKVVLKKVTAEKYTPEETADPRSTQTVVRKTVVTTTRKDDSSTGEDVMEMLKRTTVDLPVGRFAGKKMTIMDILESGLLETDEKQKLLDDYKSGKINIQDLLMSIVHIVQEKELGQTGQKISFKTVTAEKRVSETAQYTHSASAEENVEQSLQRTTVTLPIGKFSGQKISLLEVLDSGEIDEEKKTQLINDYKSGKINLEQLLLIIIEIIQTKESGAKHKVMIKQNTPESLAMGETESSLAVSKQTVVTSTVVQTSSVQGASPQEIVEHLKKTSIDVSFGRFAGKKPSVQDILDSGLIDPGKKQQLMNDLRSGKITIEQLLIIIIEIIHKKEGEQVSREELAVKKVPAVVVQEARDEPSDSKSARKVLTVAQVEADLKSISIELPSKTFSNKKVTVQELFASDTIEESKKKQLMEDYRTGKITQQQLIILIIEIITSTGKGISSKEKYVFSEEQATQNFSNTTVDVPVGKFSGKKVTIQELFQTDLIDSEKKKQLIQDYRSGKITLQVLIIIIIEIIEKREKEIKKSPITFKGFRRQVTISELMDSGLINETTASKLKDGSVSVNEVSESLKVFLEGTSSIAGVFVDRTKEILSIYAAMKRGLIRPGTAFELLEAQAATGYIIDPVKKQKLLVEEAIKLGVVGEEFKDKLLSAERAVTGYKDPYTDQKISIFQAMKKQMIVKNHGIRLLEAQIATGGIIDPHASHRIPVELAYKRGLFDEEMNQILLDPSDDTKGFFDPNTEENLTYMELLQRCSKDSSGLYLLMLKDKKPERKMSSKSSVRKRKIIVVDPDTGKEMTVYEAYMKGLIDQPTYLQLSAQESEWEEITITSSDGVTTSLLVDRKSGRQFSIDESLAEGVINEQTVQLYRSGKMTIFELGDQLSGTSSGSRSRSSSFGASSVPASPQAGSKVPSVPWSDPTEETVPIGGILDLQKFEKISITEAIRRNLVDTITGQRLLEAQACTGGIINPATGGRCSIPEAVTQGLLDKYMADKLNQANKAYHGFEDLRTKAIFHTGQAMKKGLLFQEAGTRIFEVQYLTGGIIDSGKPERIQLDEAVEKGIVDNYTAKKIRDVNSHLKYLVCPKTKARITFKDALDRSMTDEETGVRLLEASGLTSRYSASTPSSGFGSRSGSRPGSRRGSFDATGSGTPSTFLSPSSYTSTSFSRR
ncbi:uncharacterized protein LOC116945259 isoform X2 [Petromyzon marinus]|uniref:Plectin-like isoform X2 n=1 Tax=Petromyzon marinus TaxID=7757 RepID=A0AAJ7WZH5_PETMA|nr:plectin-like isoform X2 [Petromyzon marinus]